MTELLRHRGPDSSGLWFDVEQGIALGHRRLAIVDLSPAGHQPMQSTEGRYVLAFNGEIYNHLKIRRELEESFASIVWRGQSDTETLLAGISHWGITAALTRTVGMFAFALWDRQDNKLTLGRDRLGEKPLYYGWQGDTFLFGSELKALKAHPDFGNRIDRGALGLMMRYNNVPSPHSIYQGISKLPPATLLTVSTERRSCELLQYWDARAVIANQNVDSFKGSASDAVNGLELLLRDAVAQQMVADVPLGAFLSGGIDSTLVTALMQGQSGRPVRTFTIGFEEAAYNEAMYAKVVARHLGTEHTQLYISPQEAMGVIDRLPRIYCEPFSDSSQIPTLLVSQLARQQVTVCLSGDGGDELFGGYSRYSIANRQWKSMSTVPIAVRRLLASVILSAAPRFWGNLLQPIRAWLPLSLQSGDLGDRLHKAARVSGAGSVAELYQLLVSHWESPEEIVLCSNESARIAYDYMRNRETGDMARDMMAMDMQTYLPDDVLTKVDRAAMNFSLETRAPLLDHRVAEFAWSLPTNYKLRDGVGKWPLREILYRYIPKELVDRPKMGFGVPIDSWLRGPLRHWAEALLDEGRLQREGFFDPAPIRKRWVEHLKGQRNWQHQLWTVLMFQAWLEVQ